ncbi:nitroreductase [Marinimicrobium sp. ABcell2]|uniref:nitroreductase family protein n=1 Tax=Marinimicrobium sp. ABcell2 TaxID=3069751 RepID=UPI0027B042D6|nr:nitroreductase [Marinimicrobium sp. ABcell2]MDQ2075258.1 nitroreductase [Marinimicrobium sp. ABcell2]
MDAIAALHRRVSVAKVTEPAPDLTQREAIFRAATRAADHKHLQPWRFLVIEGDGLRKLGDLFVAAALSDDPEMPEKAVESLRKKPLRAPMIVVAIATCQEHPKVPEWEQVVATGAAVQNMLVAAYALGVGAFWRTGAMASHPKVIQGLGLTPSEQIVGYLYLGTPVKSPPTPKEVDVDKFFTAWPPN